MKISEEEAEGRGEDGMGWGGNASGITCVTLFLLLFFFFKKGKGGKQRRQDGPAALPQ